MNLTKAKRAGLERMTHELTCGMFDTTLQQADKLAIFDGGHMHKPARRGLSKLEGREGGRGEGDGGRLGEDGGRLGREGGREGGEGRGGMTVIFTLI